MLNLFSAFSTVGDSTTNLLSFDCFLFDSVINNESQSLVYFKTVISSLMPLLILILFSLGFALIVVIKRLPITLLVRWTIIGFLVVIYFLHPTITKYGIGIFFCVELNAGEFWLQDDLSIRCWQGDHVKLAALIGVPILLVWIVGLPLIGFLFLLKKRH